MTKLTITPDTTMYTWTIPGAAGYSLMDGITGQMSAGDYYKTTVENGDTDEKVIADLCDYLSAAEGYFLNEDDANAYAEAESLPYPHSQVLTEFTPAGVHAEIMEAGKRETEG